MKRLKQFFLSEQNVMVAILLNAMVIFFMYFPQWKGNVVLEILDNAFLLFFLLEAIVKLYVLKPKQYFSFSWNRFDFFIVLASMPTLLTHIMPVPNTSLLIVLRLFRLIRLIRFIRFIPNLAKILEGLSRAIKASVFVLAALLVLNFLLAIFTCHFYAEVAPQYFGDPLISAYSIFQMFTVEGWNEIPATIARSTDNIWVIGFSRFYFVLVVLMGGIFGMSLANAVFVDEMTVDNNRLLEEKIDTLQSEIAELKELVIQSKTEQTDTAKMNGE